jgi:hypothetical protein
MSCPRSCSSALVRLRRRVPVRALTVVGVVWARMEMATATSVSVLYKRAGRPLGLTT